MKHLFIVSLIFVTQYCLSQSANKVASAKEVIVKNWSEVAYFLPQGYWSEVKSKEITDQIGRDEFENVKKYSDLKNIPCPFLIFCNNKKKKIEELKLKLEQLHAFEIANYHQYNNSGDYKGIYSVLMVPFKGNESWDTTVIWDKVYFIISKDLVEEKK